MVRIAVFGSFYRGYFVLDELLHGPFREAFQIVGVATDDVRQPFINLEQRVWQYPYTDIEAGMVSAYAERHNVPVYSGRIKSEAFYGIYENDWRPDICIAATFGQRIDERIYGYPRFGFYNAHPCKEDGWPSRYAGPNPFKALIEDGSDHTTVALHRVDEGFDTGELIAMSPRIAIPPGAKVTDMHKITSPVIAKFVVPCLAEMAGVAQPSEQATA